MSEKITHVSVDSIPISIGTSKTELRNNDIVTNLSVEVLDFPPGTQLEVAGARNELFYLAIQGYPMTEGNVKPHLEDSDVTEAYFPLSGDINVFLEKDDPKSDPERQQSGPMDQILMRGALTADQVKNSQIKLELSEEGPTLRVDHGTHSYLMKPIVLPAGRYHSTSRPKDTKDDPLFVAIKAKKV